MPSGCKYAEADQNVKEHHVQMWREHTSEAFVPPAKATGNHLFFYDYPNRNKWMEYVCAHAKSVFFA